MIDDMHPTVAPAVVSAAVDLHNPSQDPHREIALLLLDEAVSHFISFAKKALDFCGRKT
jgi:hypothetical protein